jgi:hypothetical protein
LCASRSLGACGACWSNRANIALYTLLSDLTLGAL